ncbi:VOC family protein [Streptomyces sp. NPDC031705]|uniref:VOC family protein n=1 Tax=Streptomyces sp. NPDC031705 TaxID=3155729 RepID=UPI00340757B4
MVLPQPGESADGTQRMSLAAAGLDVRGVPSNPAPGFGALDCAVMTQRWPFIHHVTFIASDLEASTRFYTAALKPLGVVREASDGGAEFWEEELDTPSFGLYAAGDATVTRGAHIAFTARDRAAVDAFYEAALTAGGTSRHEPRLWPEYRAYCAFVDDPDGNNIEAVHKEEE